MRPTSRPRWRDQIQNELKYPGQIRVTVVRETRASTPMPARRGPLPRRRVRRAGQGGGETRTATKDQEHHIDFVIVNARPAGGYGVTPRLAEELLGFGVDCLTTATTRSSARNPGSISAGSAQAAPPAQLPGRCAGQGRRGLRIARVQAGGG